jgi:four helix bundle protein
MAAIRRFEEILSWQRARELTREIYSVSGREPFRFDRSLQDQIRRASSSVMLNIAEGFGRSTSADFARFLTQARGSATEVQCALYIALDQEYIDQATFDALYHKAGEVSFLIARFAEYLRGAHRRH